MVKIPLSQEIRLLQDQSPISNLQIRVRDDGALNKDNQVDSIPSFKDCGKKMTSISNTLGQKRSLPNTSKNNQILLPKFDLIRQDNRQAEKIIIAEKEALHGKRNIPHVIPGIPTIVMDSMNRGQRTNNILPRQATQGMQTITSVNGYKVSTG